MAQTPGLERPYVDPAFTYNGVNRPLTVTITSPRVFGDMSLEDFDVAAPEGTAVVAPADGIVALAEDDLYYTGGTVMLDHGHGLTSVFSHLGAVTATLGARVAQGEPIGRIGATGRVTGAHLDWRVNLFTTRLDPALLVGPMPEN